MDCLKTKKAYILMECMDLGSIADLLNRVGAMPEETLGYIAYQVSFVTCMRN